MPVFTDWACILGAHDHGAGITRLGQLTSRPAAGSTPEEPATGPRRFESATRPVGGPGDHDGGSTTLQDASAGLDRVRECTRAAARAAWAKGGEDTVILEIGQVLAITDAFVISSGGNRRQVAAIAEEIEARLKVDAGISPLRTEGVAEADWILLDYGDFVVHVFLDEVRRFYELERLWSDAPRVEWQEDATGVPAAR